jgi:hypothetical protein
VLLGRCEAKTYSVLNIGLLSVVLGFLVFADESRLKIDILVPLFVIQKSELVKRRGSISLSKIIFLHPNYEVIYALE